VGFLRSSLLWHQRRQTSLLEGGSGLDRTKGAKDLAADWLTLVPFFAPGVASRTSLGPDRADRKPPAAKTRDEVQRGLLLEHAGLEIAGWFLGHEDGGSSTSIDL
jgi:hypothetical protein